MNAIVREEISLQATPNELLELRGKVKERIEVTKAQLKQTDVSSLDVIKVSQRLKSIPSELTQIVVELNKLPKKSPKREELYDRQAKLIAEHDRKTALLEQVKQLHLGFQDDLQYLNETLQKIDQRLANNPILYNVPLLSQQVPAILTLG